MSSATDAAAAAAAATAAASTAPAVDTPAASSSSSSSSSASTPGTSVLAPVPAGLNPGGSRYALPPLPADKMLPLEERIKRTFEVGCEVVEPKELSALLEQCPNPVAYDGFEPSGRMHLAQGLMKAMYVNKLTSSGFTFLFWVADWFAYLNHKMGGDMAKIRDVGNYFIQCWTAVGMDMSRVRFLWASEEFAKHGDQYWSMVLDISTRFTVNRVNRCIDIMGRSEKDGGAQMASQYVYPCMQCADIFFLGVDVCQLGLDQRKVNMLAREYAGMVKRRPPVILSHGMMPGLKEGQQKASKSDPNSAIFMDDSEDEVNKKIRASFCPPKEIEKNPCMQYFKQLIFPLLGSAGFTLKRDAADGGDVHFATFETMSAAYMEEKITPQTVKPNLARFINERLAPVRKHFAENPEAAKLLALVRSYRITK